MTAAARTDDTCATRDDVLFPSIADFENGTLDAAAFDHAAHVYVAWQLLNECSLADAIHRFTGGLRRLTVALGITDKYHETISWFFIVLIAERKSMAADAQGFSQFAADNADLLTHSKQLLANHYSTDRLWSPLARQQFLLPDKVVAGYYRT